MIRRLLGILLLVLFIHGTMTGLRKGGEDFRVFHHAASLILEGRGTEIYFDSPDRFLYAPGIAWLFSPLALLSWNDAFVVWSLMKLFALVGLVAVLSRRFGETFALAGLLFFARPLLIEIRYGQVNLLILAALVFALDRWIAADRPVHSSLPGRVPRTSRASSSIAWAGLAIASATKIFPAAVLGVPVLHFFVDRKSKRRRVPLLASSITLLGLVLLPLLSVSWDAGLTLHAQWLGALQSKGLPLDTHNQSFTAFLMHVFSGKGFYSLTLGAQQTGTVYGPEWLSEGTILALGAIFAASALAFTVYLVHRIAKQRNFLDVPLLVAALILPSHLAWKPYFILAAPLVAMNLSLALHPARGKKARRVALILLSGLFLAENLASLDVVGAKAAAAFEAYAGFLWIHLALIALALALRSQKLRPIVD